MSTSPLRKFEIGLIVLAIISVIGVSVFWFSGWSLLDSLYMVAMVLSTVGLGEPHALPPMLKMFTILLMVFGVAAVFYIVGGMLQMMFEGEINRAVGLHRVTREIEQLNGHIILCGFGRMGEVLAGELLRQKKPFVVVDKDPERVAEAASMRYLVLSENATEEETLIQAGVARAKTLVTTLPSDAENVFITLTARNLNPEVIIIARGEFLTTEKKLIQAGADRVVLPAATGALRMAAMITRPSAVEFIEVVTGRQMAEVEVDEVALPAGSQLDGVTIRESQTRSRYGLLIVAYRHRSGHLQFNPGGDTVLEGGASVMVMGRMVDIDRFRAEHHI